MTNIILFTDCIYVFKYLITFFSCAMSVISVRIDKRIKKILEEAGVNISEEVKKFLNELAWKIEVKRRIERFNKVIESIKSAEQGYSADSVREDRESR